eukprot:Rhum_TRINITY_DN3766_c0_g1::Rhum_TRINITY_DN3766_c0_g1_i1::g.11970::m.11970
MAHIFGGSNEAGHFDTSNRRQYKDTAGSVARATKIAPGGSQIQFGDGAPCQSDVPKNQRTDQATEEAQNILKGYKRHGPRESARHPLYGDSEAPRAQAQAQAPAPVQEAAVAAAPRQTDGFVAGKPREGQGNILTWSGAGDANARTGRRTYAAAGGNTSESSNFY